MGTAENFVETGKSTFNGIHLTNGYHPLWFLIISFLILIAGTGKVFFIFLSIITIISALLTFHFIVKYLRKYLEKITALATSLLLTYSLLLLFRGGMEVIIVSPFLAYFIYRFENLFVKPVTLSIIASLTVLARLDSILLFALIAIPVLILHRDKVTFHFIVKILIGFIPLLLYVLINLFVFETLTPVSGSAKQLTDGLTFNTSPVVSVLNSNNLVIILLFFAIFPSVLFLKNLRISKKETDYSLLISLLFFPLIQLLFYSIVSGWQIWPWYFYSIIFAIIPASIILENQISSFINIKIVSFLIIAFVLLQSIRLSLNTNPDNFVNHKNALALVNFEQNHKGVYAIGDHAGLIGYLIESPVIQLEGLVMDNNYLNFLKNNNSLIKAFREYNVDYYVNTQRELYKNKFIFREPYFGYKYGNKYLKDTILLEELKSLDYGNINTKIYKVNE